MSALPIDRDVAEYPVIATRNTRGIEVEKEDPSVSYGEWYRFQCGDLRYYVGGTAPPPFVDVDAFIDAFIEVIDCTPPTAT